MTVTEKKLLEEAILTVRNKSFAIEEQWAIEKIEALRGVLRENHERIEIVDYGAGSPESNRTKEEMDKGVGKTQTIGEVCKIASKPPVWCQLIFQIARKFKPQNSIEMGTCLGVSSAYIASALKLNDSGTLTTLEGDPTLAAIARDNHHQLDLANVKVVTGKFTDTLMPALEEMKPVDFIFVDGHHDEAATISYFESIVPFLSDNAIMVFDDIKWSMGMQRAWDCIKRSSEAYDLGPIGVCFNARPGPL